MRFRTETLLTKSSGLNSNGFTPQCLFSASNDFNVGIAVVDRHLRFRAINRVLADMNNLPPEAHAGRPLHQVLGALITKVEPSLERVFATDQPLLNVELSGKLPWRRQPVQWLQYFFPLVDSRGRVVEINAFIVERKSSSKSIRSSNHMTGPTNKKAQLDNGRTLHPDEAYRSTFAAGACRTKGALSAREKEVLGLLATGQTNQEISTALAISVKTVETYRSRVMLKVQAPSLVHLVHYAIRNGIVELQR